MKKRMVAMVLGMAMIVSSLAGCGKTDEKDNDKQESSSVKQESSAEQEPSQSASEEVSVEAEPEEIAADHFAGTELTIAIMKYSTDLMEDRNQKEVMKKMEEETGIHINWIEVDQASAGERKKVMLAQKEQPDAYMGLLSANELLANYSLFYDMAADEELLKTYAPNVVAQYEEMAEVGLDFFDVLTLPDGSIRSLATNQALSYNSQVGGMWWINTNWLDQVGMEIPTNAEEFRAVLQAFKDTDCNGNGVADEIPLTFANGDYGAANFYNLLAAFGIGGSMKIGAPYLQMVDGMVTPTMDSDNYKAALQYYHELLADGLLDAEGFAQNRDMAKAKVADNKVGIVLNFYMADYGYQGEDFTYMKPFQALEGVEPKMIGTAYWSLAQLAGFCPTASCSNIEALLHWWNYYTGSDFETKIMSAFGLEGYGWHYVEGGWTNSNDKAVTGEDFNWANYRDNVNMGNNSWPLRTYAEAEKMIMGPAAGRLRGDSVRAMIEAGMYNNISEDLVDRFMDPLMNEERSFIEADLIPYINTFMGNAVTAGFTDADWEEYVEGLEEYGYYDWIQWYQDYYDGKF